MIRIHASTFTVDFKDIHANTNISRDYTDPEKLALRGH